MPIELDGDSQRRKMVKPRVAGGDQLSSFSPATPYLSRINQSFHCLQPQQLQPAEMLHLQRTVGNRAVANLVSTMRQSSHAPMIQRTPVDPKAKLLDQPKLPDNPPQEVTQRLAAVNSPKDTYVFENQQAFENFIFKNDMSRMKPLIGITHFQFSSKLTEATPIAQHRKSLFPMKKRTLDPKPGENNTFIQDNEAFHQLSPYQLPKMPEGNFLYKSRKQKKYKLRSKDTPNKDWNMALFQQDPNNNSKVAFNMRHDQHYLDRTLFQIDEGQEMGKGNRQMAGLDGTGKTPKWNENTIETTGKRRKLNKLPHKALVQGHGQDYESSMNFFGDYDPKHMKKDKLTESVRPIVTSDDHPSNFSPEHPIYGQNYRNYMLNHARKNYPGGSILEDTSYYDDTLGVEVPKGFGKVKIPKRKTLTLLDSKGEAKEHYGMDQVTKDKNGKFSFVDYATFAQNFHKTEDDEELEMEQLRTASQLTMPSLQDINPSYVWPDLNIGINAPTPQKDDTQTVTDELTNKNQPFFFFKEKDFK